MSAPKEFSNYVRLKKMSIEDPDEGKWLLGIDWLLLVFASMFLTFMATTLFKTLDQTTINIFVYQLLMLLGGISMGLVATITKGAKLGIVVRAPNRKDITTMFMYFFGGFIALSMLNRVIAMFNFTVFFQSAVGDSVINAGIVEEAVYSLGFTIMFLRVFKSILIPFAGVGSSRIILENIAIILAATIVSVLFAIIHLGAYGVNMQIMVLLAVNRFIYAIAFMKTRNIMVPTALHIFHNLLTLIAVG